MDDETRIGSTRLGQAEVDPRHGPVETSRAGYPVGRRGRMNRRVRLWAHRITHPAVSARMAWGLHLQFVWPVTVFSPRRRQIIRDERAQMTPRHLRLRAELDRQIFGLSKE
ncbi:hypothetical protein [Kitasatospora sp. NPDC088548]|uniref:hypothetical protein n=1 Tax=Kitasatospora sp. NPDC088548 TaxID=3364075 RepID=UPI0038163713